MHQPIPEQSVIKFYKLTTNEDIVAYEMEVCKGHYKIARPLAFSIENEIIAGRQMMNVREWLPPLVCSTEIIFLPKEYVMFATDVNESFKVEFKDAVDYLYSVTPRKRGKTSSNNNITPYAFIMKDTSDKPH
jgi:hypothetical protein